MDANRLGNQREQLGNLETDRLGLIDEIIRVEVDCINEALARLRMPPMKRRGEERAGKSAGCANLHRTIRS